MQHYVLVTGGSSGIGKAIIERLAAEGFHTLNLDRLAPAQPSLNERHVAVDLLDTDELGKVLADDGITANAIGPGPIATELFKQVNPPDAPQTAQILKTIPALRLGEPAEVAHAVHFFLDDRAGFITGQVLYVCGGMTVGLGNAS